METIVSDLPPSSAIPERQVFVLSVAGVRAENQDNYLYINAEGSYQYLYDQAPTTGNLQNWHHGGIRLVVADGMGGHNNGRQASEALIQALLELPFQRNAESLKDAIIAIHLRLFQRFHQGAKTPGSTLVLVDIDQDGKASMINIGDSRLYHYRQAELQSWKQLSKDHTQSEFAWRDGEISDDTYFKSLQTNTNQIAQAVGFGSSGIIPNQAGIKTRQHQQALRIDSQHQDILDFKVQEGDFLLLATDGVWSGKKSYVPVAPNDDLEAYVREQVRKSLEDSTDNITLLFASC